MIKLRHGRKSAPTAKWYENGIFLINAAPGAGKTITACVIAKSLFEDSKIDGVVLIAPRKAVVDQWTADFRQILNRGNGKITGADEEPEDYGTDYAATWSAVQSITCFSKYMLHEGTLVYL